MFRPACTDLWAPFLFSPQGLRVRPAPGIPCALFRERDTEIAKPGRKSRRGDADGCLTVETELSQLVMAGLDPAIHVLL